MRLDRSPNGKFIDRGSALYWWLPKMLDWIYGGADNAVNFCLLRIADWLCEEASFELKKASMELLSKDGECRNQYVDSRISNASRLRTKAARLREVAKEFNT